jgi:hypothetical protein
LATPLRRLSIDEAGGKGVPCIQVTADRTANDRQQFRRSIDWLPTTAASKVPSSSKDFFHLRIKASRMPKSLATAVYDKPCSMTFLTAASLN